MSTKTRDRSPLYVQLRELIRSQIESGQFAPGTSLPSENALAQTYGLNRSAVHSALQALEYEGLLQSIQGKGSFVLGPKLTRDMETLGGFRQTMLDRDQNPSTKVLHKVLRKAGPLYSRLLEIPPTAPVWYVKRICYAGSAALALEEIFIPEDLLPDFDSADISLFSIMDIYHWNAIYPLLGQQTLSIAFLDPSQSKLIGLEGKQAVLEFSGIMRTKEGRIVEFSRSYTRQDKAEFKVHYQDQEEN